MNNYIQSRAPILSICIPTYNRCIYLKRMLDSLLPQIEQFGDMVEVIISDNASTDDSVSMCQKTIISHRDVKIHVNEKNEGPDYNISYLYKSAKGKFVWILGDDEYLRIDALSNIMTLLGGNTETDLIYVNSSATTAIEPEVYVNNEDLSFQRYESGLSFAKKIGVHFTFISGVIINKDNVGDVASVIETNQGTYLVQLSWVFSALKSGDKFIYINNKYVISQQDNSGGYRLYTVFGKNLSSIVFDFFQKSPISAAIRTDALKLLIRYMINASKSKFIHDASIRDVMDFSFSDLSIYRSLYKWIVYYPRIYMMGVRLKNKFMPKLKWIIKKHE